MRAAPSGRVSTMRTGSEEPSEKAACSFATRVDSADAGRNDALSLEETSLSLPERGPATLPMSSQPMATATAIHTALRPERLRVTGRVVGSGAHADSVSESAVAPQIGRPPSKVIDSSTKCGDTGSVTDWTPADGPMPALYLGHGAPPLLDDALWTAELSAWAAEPAPPARHPHRVGALGDRAGEPVGDGRGHAAGLRLRRLRAQVLRDDLPDARRLGARRARHVDAARHRAGAPARAAAGSTTAPGCR